MQRSTILLLLVALISCHSGADKENRKAANKILVLLAHPDDETAMAPMLAALVREGKEVTLAIAADGRYGVEKHAGIPAGDTLAAIRQKETICACEILGIKDVRFLGFHDGLGVITGVGEYFRQTTLLKEKIKALIDELQPDAILSFGPDGDTGHLDHKAVGDMATEVILREGWYQKYPLYYLAWQKEKKTWIPQGDLSSLNYLHKNYLSVQIPYTIQDKEKALQTYYCYKTQFAADEVGKMIQVEMEDSVLFSFFRPLVLDTLVRTHF